MVLLRAFLLTAGLCFASAVVNAQQPTSPEQVLVRDFAGLNGGVQAIDASLPRVVDGVRVLLERLQTQDAQLRWYQQAWSKLKPEAESK